MVTIRSVRLVPFAIPLRRPLATAYGCVTVRRGVVVVLVDASGRHGVGEATPHPAAPPDALTAVHRDLERAARWLAGSDLSHLDPLLAAAAQLERPAAMAVDMALHDLLGRATGRSLTELLGGARRDAVVASALLPDVGSADAAREAAARGFTTAKVKLGPEVDGAVVRVAMLRAAAPALALRCDANGAWDAETATAVARRLAPLGVAWLEQPVPAADVAGLARVRRDGGVPIAADEAVTSVSAIDRLAGAADAVVLKLEQLGGLGAARAAAEAAVRHGLQVTVTTGLETGLAATAALHLAAALPGPLEPCGLATGTLLADDLLQEPVPEGPRMRAPQGPGLGVVLDEVALARWRTG
jgi:o-succinylbenzoate synthase